MAPRQALLRSSVREIYRGPVPDPHVMVLPDWTELCFFTDCAHHYYETIKSANWGNPRKAKRIRFHVGTERAVSRPGTLG